MTKKTTDTSNTREPQYVCKGTHWHEAAVRGKWQDIIDNTNSWSIPLMRYLGIEVSRENVTAIAGADNKREWLQDRLAEMEGEGRSDLWQPSVIRAITKETERKFNDALHCVVMQQREFIFYEEMLLAGREHYDAYMEDPEAYEDYYTQKELRRMKADIWQRDEAESRLSELRNLKHQVRERWEGRMEQRRKETVDLLTAEWERFNTTPADITRLWPLIDMRVFNEEESLALDEYMLTLKTATFARTPEELDLLDTLNDIVAKVNAIGGRGALIEFTDFDGKGHAMRLRPDIDQHVFSTYARTKNA